MAESAPPEDRLPALRTTYNTLDLIEAEASPDVEVHVTKTIEEVRRHIDEFDEEGDS